MQVCMVVLVLVVGWVGGLGAGDCNNRVASVSKQSDAVCLTLVSCFVQLIER